MGLIDLKTYLMRMKVASLTNICSYFNVEAGLLRDMLSHWIRKGKIRQFAKTAACGTSCGQCKPDAIEIYEWI